MPAFLYIKAILGDFYVPRKLEIYVTALYCDYQLMSKDSLQLAIEFALYFLPGDRRINN